MLVTHINDEPLAQTWQGVLQQMSLPHPITKCWVLKTEYNGTTSQFVMTCKQMVAK